jgi:predicted O-methyltransferase YrrM
VGSRVVPPYDVGPGVDAAARPMGLPMCQNRLSVPTWSYAMEVHPPARIVELGTYGGGFTCALALHARQIGARVVTFDRMLPDERLADLATFLRVEFRTRDIWEAQGEIADLIRQPGVAYVLCDGGDKRRELATFAAHLKPGDVIAAHDYAVDDGAGYQNAWWGWGEVDLADGDRVAREHDLEPWMQDHFDTAAWLAYRKAQ